MNKTIKRTEATNSQQALGPQRRSGPKLKVGGVTDPNDIYLNSRRSAADAGVVKKVMAETKQVEIPNFPFLTI